MKDTTEQNRRHKIEQGKECPEARRDQVHFP